MFTTSKKIADAKVNGKLFLVLMLAGALVGVLVYVTFLPNDLASVAPWRIFRALLIEPALREYLQANYHLVTLFFVDVAAGAIGLPIVIALLKNHH